METPVQSTEILGVLTISLVFHPEISTVVPPKKLIGVLRHAFLSPISLKSPKSRIKKTVHHTASHVFSMSGVALQLILLAFLGPRTLDEGSAQVRLFRPRRSPFRHHCHHWRTLVVVRKRCRSPLRHLIFVPIFQSRLTKIK